MDSNFNQVLLQNCLDKIVEKSKERSMLAATERGLVSEVAKMIDEAIYPFRNKGLKVRSGHDYVRYWLTTSEAKKGLYSIDEIEVTLGFACSPAEIMGRGKLTKKESEIATELQKIWDRNTNYNYFYDFEKFKGLAEKLNSLSHHLRCYTEIKYFYDIDNYYLKEDLLSKHYCLSDLTGDTFNMVSTRDLVSLRDLFG